MARCSISNAKLVSAFVVDRVSLSVSRRGYAATPSQSAGSGSAKKAIANKGGDKEMNNTSWVPDPKTGCYRPESHANDINVAELHEALLNNKISRH